jgi:hypothetical protein
MSAGLYVYAIGRAGHPLPEGLRAIESGGLAAFYMPVELEEYSQTAIDRRAGDVEWLGAIGYRHQSVMNDLMHGGTIIPLRAFTLYSDPAVLRKQLDEHSELYAKILGRLDGKQEWTLRVEFEPEAWHNALVQRVESLRNLAAEAEKAGSGKAFLLRKKLDEEKKRVSRDEEQKVVAEIERAILDKLACDTVAETRQQRSGAFPQINVLINRDEEAVLQEIANRYSGEGIAVAITGPWPPYSFAGTMGDER